MGWIQIVRSRTPSLPSLSLFPLPGINETTVRPGGCSDTARGLAPPLLLSLFSSWVYDRPPPMFARSFHPRQFLRAAFGTEPFVDYCQRRGIAFEQVLG